VNGWQGRTGREEGAEGKEGSRQEVCKRWASRAEVGC
jgi:hypothetical protein